MAKPAHLHVSDLHHASRLAVDGIIGVSHIVESMHRNIAARPGLLAPMLTGPSSGLTGFVYRSIRAITSLSGGLLTQILRRLPKLERSATPERDAALSILNGVIGDHLAHSGNALAISMQFRRQGEALPMQREALSALWPEANSRLMVFVHGLCMNDRHWANASGSPAARLAADAGFIDIYLHYNSGRHISHNGRDFARLLAALLAQWPKPVSELVIIGHSMGGLVARSACHHAKQAHLDWLTRLRAMVFLGTPHHGAPLERGGNVVDRLLAASPYSAPLARLGRLRSAGITDLRHGYLRDSDWQGEAPGRGADAPSSLPLPAGIACFALAATLGKRDASLAGRLLGDGLVPIDSALGRHQDRARQLAFTADHCAVVPETGHLAMLGSEAVFAQLARWLDATLPDTAR
ncbi:esterase/lipase family protein [Chitinimonas sp.]|uniref:esterase/lipase family protein n=1 Tax=Chitinimonas sp. TaxID=1934313 RepID=UPI0035AE6D50